MTWVMIIFLVGTVDIQVTEHGFRSYDHCVHRAKTYMQHLDDTKYHWACYREGKSRS